MAVLDESPGPVLRRLMRWLTPFKACFGHRAEAVSLGGYVSGTLERQSAEVDGGDARARDGPGRRITPCSTSLPTHHGRPPRCGGCCARRLPERRGLLLLDDTGFPKKGTDSVGSPGNTAARWARLATAKWR